MLLKTLTLQNFRSYSKKSFSFSPSTTLIIGSNASGKTNILEAIFFLATSKSFRAERDRDALLWEAELGRIIANIKKDDELMKLELVLTQGMVTGQKTPIKKYLVNGVSKRGIDFVGNIKTVLFWPEDLLIVTGSPSRRRQYLDSVLVQVDREYRRSLRSYEKGLRQRNRVLRKIKEGNGDRSHLLFWDQLLIKNGNYLMSRRAMYIDFINSNQWLDDENNRFSIVYDKSVISEGRIKQYEREEVEAGVTLVGPHRDDIKFKVKSSKLKVNKERDLASFGSRGEQRLCVLWLKLAELVFIEKETGEKPLLLLDDIFSELDHKHREVVFSLFNRQQTIVTTADEHTISESYKERMEVVLLK